MPTRRHTIRPHRTPTRVLLALSAAISGCARADRNEISQGGAAPDRNATPDHAPDRKPETISLLRRPLFSLDPAAATTQLDQLSQARAAFAESPDDPERIIWVARRLGYLWRMNDAIAEFSSGIRAHPRHAPLYRHRGHRYISIRQFDNALADLKTAAELIRDTPDQVEPDGMPNARNIPLTTTAFNVWYHLALAHYLRGNFDQAVTAWCQALNFTCGFDDNKVALTYWIYLSLRRLGRHEEALALLEPIRPGMDIIENRAYHRLLLHFKGDLTLDAIETPADPDTTDAATLHYGIGAFALCSDDRVSARRYFEKAVSGNQWPAFGFIAAEVELHRMNTAAAPAPK